MVGGSLDLGLRVGLRNRNEGIFFSEMNFDKGSA